VLREFSFPEHPSDPYRFFVGDGMEVLARRAAPPGTPDQTIKLMTQRMGETYRDNWDKLTHPYPGIKELLDELTHRGLPLGVLSNKPDPFTQLMIRHYFGESRFGAIAGAKPEVAKKPDPAGALALAQDLAVAPADFLYLGDTNTDMKTALAAGMLAVGVTWGFRPRRELEDAGAEFIIDHPQELLAKLC
jgi:phosphoglycolate phosphatase